MIGVETGTACVVVFALLLIGKQRDIYVVYSCVSQTGKSNNFNELCRLRRNFAGVS
jgi:hypothetical protein